MSLYIESGSSPGLRGPGSAKTISVVGGSLGSGLLGHTGGATTDLLGKS